MENMDRMRRWYRWTAASLFLALGVVCGCQTWVPPAGLTLPTGHYLEHPPQYIPSSPAFPLSRELATQENVNTQAIAGGGPQPLEGGGALPAPVPVLPGPAGPNPLPGRGL